MINSKKVISIEFEELSGVEKLSREDQDLFEQASMAADTAYAPYSLFKVGAAIYMEDGIIISGSNQENAAYPSGLCAERVAIFSASARYPGKKMKKMAIVAKNNQGIIMPVTPCGACRQVLLEYEDKLQQALKVIMSGKENGIVVFYSAASLLPFGFRNTQLP